MFSRIKTFFKQSKSKTKGLILRLRLLSRKKDTKPIPLILGEIAYNVDNRSLVVGDGVSETGCIVANVVLGPHDGNLYIKVEDIDKYIPLRIGNYPLSIKGYQDI